MIPFFRKIRKKMADDNKPLKYMRYAIGEIVLVVIGILIALQINNWNEHNKEKKLIKSYAQSLIIDLEEDIKGIDNIQSQIVELSCRIDSLANYVRNKSLEDLSNLTILMYIIDDHYSPYVWNDVTIEELKSSGALRFTGNADIAKKIGVYDGFKSHLLDDYEADKALVELNFPLVRSSINMNYSNYKHLASIGRNNLPRFSQGLENYEYRDVIIPILNEQMTIAEKEKLSLLAKDVNAINELVNGYLKLSRHLRLRGESELPELKKMAEEIIELLKTKHIN